MSWPISVITVSTITCGNLLWSMEGTRYATAIVKATFQLHHEKPATLTNPIEIVSSDRAFAGAQSDESSELAPYLPGLSVLVRGHACTPGGKPATAVRLRLGLYQEQWLLNKTAYAYGDRGRNDPSPAPFSRLPLVWERAYGGPSIAMNPRGVGAIPGESKLPNFVDASVPTHPVGFGPVPGNWPSRARFLRGASPPDRQHLELAKGFDFRYFHPAPPDQQLQALPSHGWIYLEGMHPDYPWVRAPLPTAKAQARLHRTAPSQVDAGSPIALSADTLVIHADELTCSILWRGTCPLSPEDAPERLLMVAGLELPGHPIAWPNAETLRIAARGLERSSFLPGDGTQAVSDTDLLQIKQRQLAPFAIAGPSRDRSPPSPDGAVATPWGSPTGRIPIPPRPDMDQTAFAPPPAPPVPPPQPSKDVGGQTIDARSLNLQRNGPALPFQHTPPGFSPTAPERVSADTPFAMPFGHGPLPAPPAPSADLGASTMIHAPSREPPPPPPPLPPPVLVQAPEAEPIAPMPILEPAPEELPPKPQEPQGFSALIAAKLLQKEPLGNLPLAGRDLSGIDFSGAMLDHISFANATLARCRFEKASLLGADLSGADLSEAHFEEAQLERADLSNTKLDKAHFGRAMLKEAKLAFSKGEFVRFEGACLEGADLKTVRWPDASLVGANFCRAMANKADFSRARLDGAKLDEAVMRGAKLKQAVLAHASVMGADLRDADLSLANVFSCKLDTAKTAGAVLRGLDSDAPSEQAADGKDAP